MTNRANIFYDNEIDELVRNQSVQWTIPAIQQMFALHPEASFDDVFYTISEYVRHEGTEGFPEALLNVPVMEQPEPEPTQEPTPEETEPVEQEEPEPDVEEALTEPTLSSDEERAAQARARRRKIRNRHSEDNDRNKVNVRNLMNDVKDMDL